MKYSLLSSLLLSRALGSPLEASNAYTIPSDVVSEHVAAAATMKPVGETVGHAVRNSVKRGQLTASSHSIISATANSSPLPISPRTSKRSSRAATQHHSSTCSGPSRRSTSRVPLLSSLAASAFSCPVARLTSPTTCEMRVSRALMLGQAVVALSLAEAVRLGDSPVVLISMKGGRANIRMALRITARIRTRCSLS